MKRNIHGLAGIAILLILFSVNAWAQVSNQAVPRMIEKNGRHALLVDGEPFLILGGQAHNSSAWPGMLPQVWTSIKAMNANTLEVPLYWEQIEAQQGHYDFSIIDTLLIQAREHKVRLVLLWFATWKNGSNHYMPEWMKMDSKKHPNIIGKDGKPVDSPSPHSQATLELDAKAFAQVMSYLKKADPQHTVIMVQVQNEPGAWGSVRDYSPEAQKIFNSQVPAALLKPEILKALNKPVVSKGSWQEVFGNDADEYFHAWSVASYIEQVAKAGRAENELPLYVNVALRDPLTNPSANTYESGGATDNVIPIYKAAAPTIDILAPDIYLQGSDKVLKVLDLYDRADNALFVPEIGSSDENSKYFYSVLSHGGIGFSPFGIDDNGEGETLEQTRARLSSVGKEYAMAAPMMRELARWSFEGKIKSVVEREDHASQTIDLGAWQAIVTFNPSGRRAEQANTRPMGRAMVVQLAENEFILIGSLCHFTFQPLGKNEGKAWQYLKVDEGNYENGTV
jgi:beta-galactosidase GanA